MSDVKIMATVAGEPITETEFNRYLETLPREQQAYVPNPYFQKQVLDQIINTRLMTRLALDEKLDETEKFKETMASIRGDILAQMAIDKIATAVTVSDEEAEAYFKANEARFSKGASVGAKHILVEEESKAQEILAELNSGSISFDEAASKYSTCPSKERGGDLGEFGHGQMVKEFDEAAFAAEIDTVTEPVKTQFGYHLIKVYKKTEASVPAFAEIADSVKNNMLNEKRNTAIQATLMDLKARYLQ